MRLRPTLLVASALLSLSAAGAESDPYWAWRQPPDDATEGLDRAINRELVRGLADVNARRPATCREAARLLTAPLHITSDHFFRSAVRRWPVDRSPRRPIERTPWSDWPEGKELAARPRGSEFDRRSIYRSTPLFPFGHLVPLDPTLSVDGVLLGPDKIGHFFTNGFRSWERALDARAAGADVDEALRAALLYGVDEEKGWLGLGIDGIFSYADLHAASAGMRFFDALCGGGLVHDDDGGWSLSGWFSLAAWVDPCWDESFATNAFADREAEAVQTATLEVCPLLKDPAVQARRSRYRARGCNAATASLLSSFVREGLAPSSAPWDVDNLCAGCARLSASRP